MANSPPPSNERKPSEIEQRYLDMLDVSSNWMWETDREHRYTYLSEQLFKETDLKPEDIYGKTRPEIAALTEWITAPEDLKK